MDSSAVVSPLPRSPFRARSVAGWSVILLAAIFYGVLLARNMGAYAGGSDSSGYLNTARLFREHHVLVDQRTIAQLPPGKLSDNAYIPLGFRSMDHDKMVPTYPIGLPLLVLAVSKVSGWDAAPGITLWLHAMLGVGLMFVLARQVGLKVPWAFLAALMLGASPLYLFMAVQPMSDMPALVWSMAAVVCAWRSREKSWWSLAAGVAFATAVLVRPTNVLALAPLAIALGISWRRWLGFGVGGLPGAGVFCAYNRAAYGDAFASGYGDVTTAFSREFVLGTLVHYAHWVPILLTPVIVGVLGLPWLIRSSPRWVALLSAWALTCFGFYACYICTHETWWYLRFVLPAFPALIAAGLLVIQRVLARGISDGNFQSWIAVGILGMFVGVWSSNWTERLNALGVSRDESVYSETANWAREKLPANAVVFAMQSSGSLLYYTDFTVVRWDQISSADVAKVQQATAAAARPLYAMLFREEEKDQNALQRIQPGTWEKIGAVRQVNFWKWTGLSPISAEKH